MPNERTDRAPGPRTSRLFSYLDGEMDAGERAGFEAEIAGDSALAAEVASWRGLLAALDDAAAFAPSPDFRVRVLASLNAPRAWWARLLDRLHGARAAHPPNVFAALLDEGLATRGARALTDFAARDPEAAAALAGWRRFYRQLDALPAFAPSEGFADRVMARVRIPGRSPAVRPAAVRSATGIPVPPAAARRWALARGWIGGRWPSPRDRFAATAGLAVGPFAALFVTLRMLSDNPLITTSNVTTFVQTRAGAAVSRLATSVFESPTAGQITGWIGGVLDDWTPGGPALAAVLAVFAALTLASARILYTNVIKVPQSENRHVPA